MVKLDNIYLQDEIENAISYLKPVVSCSIVGKIVTGQTKNFRYCGNIIESADLNNGDEVVIGGVNYIVSNVTDGSFEVDSEPTGATYQKLAPYYYHGTPISLEKQRAYDRTKENKLRYPFIAFFKPSNYKINYDQNEKKYQDTTLWLIYMASANTGDWTQEQHDNLAIKPMNQLCTDLTYILKTFEGGLFNAITTAEITEHTNFGITARFSGHTKAIITENLSGIEQNLNVITNKKYKCYET